MVPPLLPVFKLLILIQRTYHTLQYQSVQVNESIQQRRLHFAGRRGTRDKKNKVF
jgi:hypothetical protein